MKTLKLFNAVISRPVTNVQPIIDNDIGIVVEPNAVWDADAILDYYHKEKLSGNDLNKTFYNSWITIRNSSRYQLYVDQIIHYFSTYGTNFEAEMYIPRVLVDIPDFKLKYVVIKAYTKEEMTEKCLDMLKSGIALTEETIDDLLHILVNELGYQFKGNEGIRNKEAIIKLADMYGILPQDVMELFRYIIYRATGQTLLIKSPKMIAAVKFSTYNPIGILTSRAEDFATIFNRFKPLFLAFKPRASKAVNRISKMSKYFHVPMVQNPLNNVGSQRISPEDNHWLENATPFALFKALAYCHTRIQGQDTFAYRIRNGKSYTKEGDQKPSGVAYTNRVTILSFLRDKYQHLKGKKVYMPYGIDYALPTSEKMYVGNIPMGTKFSGEKLAVGIYWKNSWGARDLDLSGLNIGGKVGWNSDYRQGERIYFSGDITDAPNGAVEYLYANNGLNDPTLVMNNVYSGDPNCDFKIIIGKGGNIDYTYMMNPDNLFAEFKVKSVDKQSILGLFIPEGKSQSFVVMNMGQGQARVSGYGKAADMTTKALYQQWSNPYKLWNVLDALGCDFVKNADDADYNLSLDNLEKDTFVKLFTEPLPEPEITEDDPTIAGRVKFL